MLTRLKPSPFPSLSSAINLLLLKSSPLSSTTNPKTLKPLSTKPPISPNPSKNPTAALQLRYESHPFPLKPSNPTAQFILSLLSEPSNHSQNLDNLLIDFKHELNSELVLEILKNYKRLGRPKTLEFFSWVGFQLGFRFDDNVVEFMADFLGRRKLFDDLKCLLKTVSASKGRISTRTVSVCIRFLGRQGRVSEALALFEMMELEFNCCPDNLVFNNVLYVLCKKDSSGKSIDVALSIFRKIRDPDKYSYSNVIVGLCKFGRLESAFEVFCKMGRGKIVPTRSAANVLVGKLCEMASKSKAIEKVRVSDVRRPFDILVPNVRAKCGIEPAYKVFWAVLKLGVMPSSHVVNGLILELCRVGKFEEAVEIVNLVEDRKLRCIDECYSIVIKALCEVHKVNEACEMFERMLFLGLRPKLAVYNSIICVHCKLGNVEEAEKYFGLLNKRRIEPDCATYITLIHAYCMNQNWEAANSMLIEMIDFGWHPHKHTYNLVDNLLNKIGRPDLSLKLERKTEIQKVLAHCKAGRLDDACHMLNSMLAKGYRLPVYAKDSIQRTFRRSGKWKIVQDLLEKMDQSGIHNSFQA